MFITIFSICEIQLPIKCIILVFNWFFLRPSSGRGCSCGVMVKAMDCGTVVSEFVLQSCYYVHFRAKYTWERYEPPYPPSYGLNSTTTVLGMSSRCNG